LIGLGLVVSGLGLGLGLAFFGLGLGLGLALCGLVNITGCMFILVGYMDVSLFILIFLIL